MLSAKGTNKTLVNAMGFSANDDRLITGLIATVTATMTSVAKASLTAP